MDWTTQNKLVKWLIGILLVVNILTITIIWVLIVRDKPPMPFEQGKKFSNGIDMLQKELNLTDEQKNKFEDSRKENFAKSDVLFKQLMEVKNNYFGELQKENTDTVLVNSLLNKMSLIQIQLEKLRFEHFRYLLSICTKEQKEKFKPVLKSFLVGKPPREMEKGKPMPGFSDKDGMKGDMPPPPPDGKMNNFH